MPNRKYDQNNVFAKIIRGELSAKIVYQDDQVLAFYDLYPLAPVHVLVIPKKSFIDYSDFVEHASAEEVAHYFRLVNKIAKDELDLDQVGFRLCTNRGERSGQSVFHFHTHILSGAKFAGFFEEVSDE